MDKNGLSREMGLGPLWRLRQPGLRHHPEAAASATDMPALHAATTSTTATSATAFNNEPDVILAATMDWPELARTVAGCQACGLCAARKQAVLGVGDRDADWLIVGEAPGALEDACGEPFVGQAGALLDNMLASIGLRRGNNVYITDTVKCRPPDNRPPVHDESAACRTYLEQQIALTKPELIIAVGETAAQTLLKTKTTIAQARGKLHATHGVPLIVTYHPTHLLVNLLDKAKAWEDLVFIRATMRSLKEGTS